MSDDSNAVPVEPDEVDGDAVSEAVAAVGDAAKESAG